MTEQLSFFEAPPAADTERDEDGKGDGVDRTGWVTVGQEFDLLTPERQRERFEFFMRCGKPDDGLTFEVYALALYRPRTGQPSEWKARVQWARERLALGGHGG